MRCRLGPQSAEAKSSAGIAASVWLVIVPREPSSTETLAIVFVVGRLDDGDEVVLAERRPLGDDLGADLLDLLVHLGTRPGLFFRVWTPSAVRLVSIT